MYESKNNYGLSGAGVQIIWNCYHVGVLPKTATWHISAYKALKAFEGTGSFDSPDTDILKGIMQEFGKDTVLRLTYPEEERL